MPFLSHGVVTRTFGPPVASCFVLLNTNSKTPKFSLQMDHGVETASFIIHLQSFACVIVVQE